jgi:hypothetical protein
VAIPEFAHFAVKINLDCHEAVCEFKAHFVVVVILAVVVLAASTVFVVFVVVAAESTTLEDTANLHVSHDSVDGFLVGHWVVGRFYASSSLSAHHTGHWFVPKQHTVQALVGLRCGNVAKHLVTTPAVKAWALKRTRICGRAESIPGTLVCLLGRVQDDGCFGLSDGLRGGWHLVTSHGFRHGNRREVGGGIGGGQAHSRRVNGKITQRSWSLHEQIEAPLLPVGGKLVVGKCGSRGD